MERFLNKETNLLTDKNGNVIKKFSEAEGNLLFEFISQRGVCLSRDQLISIAWPNTIVVENSLNMAIRKLRAAGIDIETIPRKGYTLIDNSVELTTEIKYAVKESVVKESEDIVSEDIVSEEYEPESIGKQRVCNPYFARENNIEPLTRKVIFNRYKEKILLAYLLILLIVHLTIEGNKPDVDCYGYESVEICTSEVDFNFNIEEIKQLAEGKYIYGKRFDDENSKHYIQVEY